MLSAQPQRQLAQQRAEIGAPFLDETGRPRRSADTRNVQTILWKSCPGLSKMGLLEEYMTANKAYQSSGWHQPQKLGVKRKARDRQPCPADAHLL